MIVSSRFLILRVTKDATPFGIQVLTFSARHLKRSMVASFALDPETQEERWYIFIYFTIQGFYYDAYYGELGLNDNHLKQIDAAVLKVVADDAHIFCRKSQIKAEVRGVLEFIDYAYEKFGFTYDLKLSAFNEGDGAFYGPKIDISVSDALKEISVCHIAGLDC
ncbi:hypothetical protein DKX38_015490 [Salix brachista]|uniref:Uncharacterized protein n=1 Tax=Salix brachista TaxID=2182728 RepID=A0A5N5L5C6_9ROSI|nr:hypothetical protein DKX38_015490 [Salix brachista]